MKKVVIWLSFIGIFLFYYNLDCLPKKDVVIVVSKKDGGPSGFNTVSEAHYYREDCECFWHELNCHGAGYTECTWTTPPSKMRLIEYAEEEIMKGNLNGLYESFFDGKKHVVEWQANDIFNARITETIYEAPSN